MRGWSQFFSIKDKLRKCKHHEQAQFVEVKRYSLRVALLGSAKVGKSCFLERLIMDKFEVNYHSTWKDFYDLSLKFDDSEMLLNVIDIGGKKQLKALQKQTVREVDAFILVFSLINYATFEDVLELYKEIIRIKSHTATGSRHGRKPLQHIPIVVVGNKQDLLEQREVTLEEIKRVVENNWDCPYVEISVKCYVNLLSVLSRLRDEVELSGLAEAKLLEQDPQNFRSKYR